MKNPNKLALAVIAAGTLFLALFLSGCNGGGGSAAPDMSPVGDGLSFIGLGLVLAAIISLIGIIFGGSK